MKNRKAVDVQNIFHKLEQRTLVAAYKFYCDKDLTNAHSAEADTTATYEVLLSQLEKYEELENDVNFLADFSQIGGEFVDMAGFVHPGFLDSPGKSRQGGVPWPPLKR